MMFPKLRPHNHSGILGFTMIELLIVIAVIGILASLFITNYPSTQTSARDARRLSDIKQYQTAVESYANRNSGFYPSYTTASGERLSTTLCAPLGLTNCPEEPKLTNFYRYQSNGSGGGAATATSYVMWVQLENPRTPLTYFISCSNGRSAKVTSGIPPSGGNCP